MTHTGKPSSVLLRNFDRWGAGLWLEPELGRRRALDRERAPELGGSLGWAVQRDGVFMALFRSEGGLRFFVDGEVYDVDDADCSVRVDGLQRVVTFTRVGVPVVSVEFADAVATDYRATAPYDFTAAQLEDFDWAVFLADTFADPARRNRVGRPHR